MRAVVRRVHPDIFAAHPYERAKNTESLKVRADGHVIDLACVFGSLKGQNSKAEVHIYSVQRVAATAFSICNSMHICALCECLRRRSLTTSPVAA